MARLPLEELGSTAGERRLLRRVGVVLAAATLGAGVGIGAYTWADSRISAVEVGLANHLAEMRILRPRMDEYVQEERAARCSIARNVYALCLRTSVKCEPVGATCKEGR